MIEKKMTSEEMINEIKNGGWKFKRHHLRIDGLDGVELKTPNGLSVLFKESYLHTERDILETAYEFYHGNVSYKGMK